MIGRSLEPFSGSTMRLRGVSSAGRAPALQAGGRRFDPGTLHQFCCHWCDPAVHGPSLAAGAEFFARPQLTETAQGGVRPAPSRRDDGSAA
jgi:hypothetical protein